MSTASRSLTIRLALVPMAQEQDDEPDQDLGVLSENSRVHWDGQRMALTLDGIVYLLQPTGEYAPEHLARSRAWQHEIVGDILHAIAAMCDPDDAFADDLRFCVDQDYTVLYRAGGGDERWLITCPDAESSTTTLAWGSELLIGQYVALIREVPSTYLTSWAFVRQLRDDADEVEIPWQWAAFHRVSGLRIQTQPTFGEVLSAVRDIHSDLNEQGMPEMDDMLIMETDQS